MIGWTLMPATIPPTTYSVCKLRERSSQLFRSREGLLELLECKCKAIRMKTEEVTIKKGSKIHCIHISYPFEGSTEPHSETI